MRSVVGLLGAASILAAGCQRTLTPGNGRCGPTPHLLVGASAFGVEGGVGTVPAGVSAMVLDGSDLYYVLSVSSAPGTPAQASSGPGAVMHVSTYGDTPLPIAGGYAFRAPALTPTTVILGEMGVDTSEVDIATVPRSGGTQTTLATVANSVLFLAPVTDGTSIYFSDGTGVESVPLAPASPPVTPMRLSPFYPNNIGAFGQGLLMLLPDGTVASLPIAPGDAGTLTTLGAGAASVPQTLIPCGNNACWLSSGGEIDQIDPATGTMAVAATLTGPVANPSGLVFDGKSFFVVGTNSPGAGSAAIVSVPSQGGAQTVVATLPSAGAIAVDDACVYFSTSTGIFSLMTSAQNVVIP